MGYSSWSDAAFRAVADGRSGTEVFSGNRAIDPRMDPRGVRAREARDSEHHPESVPIVVAFDVTGSMGHVPRRFAEEALGRLMRRLVENRWVTDPQVLLAAIGDAESDRAPLQIGQFESGLEMDLWLTRLWLEGGGGDAPESYALAHWFAAHHTATDAWEKRRRPGYLFTIGDAEDKPLDRAQLERVFGAIPDGAEPSSPAAVRAASERWRVFHVNTGYGLRNPRTIETWTQLGVRLLPLDEPDAVCEVIGVAIGLGEGRLDAAGAARILAEAKVAPEFAAQVIAAAGA